MGLVVAAIGTTPWAFLVGLNFKYASAVPWAVPVTAVYLWFYWRYFTGAWGPPRSNLEARKKLCRANALSDEVWGAALLAGVAGLAFIVVSQTVLDRMIRLPMQATDELPHVPVLMLFFSIIMGAIVAGVAEESAFRGYMQGPLERRHGPVVAILTVGVLFGFAHFSHPEVGFAMMPYYIIVATVYGMLAYFTNSILPSLVLH
ncbi:MAG TPA: type II CAAX endopeptidase family protein, partial [Puia sp.]|nr:type II CAAX endopeptidase family protein [Puia sp.]